MVPASLLRFQLCACLVSRGLQRTFIPWQRRWRPTLPRRDMCWRLDYRGHGQSKYDRYPSNYTPFVALADLLAVLTEFKIGSATFIGTSYGGLLALMLAVSRPAAIAGVVLNDIGPVIELEGLLRLKLRIEGLGGKIPIPRNFEEGAEIMRWLLHKDFPKLAPQDWIAFARRTWRERGDRLVPDFDPKVARMLQRHLEHPPAMWSEFDALARVPLMVIRGSNSDLLTSTTLNAMLARRGELTVAVVADQGHAPLLVEPKLIRRIATFVASCDLPARS